MILDFDNIGWGWTSHISGWIQWDLVITGSDTRRVAAAFGFEQDMLAENIMTANSRLAEKYQAAHPDIRNIKKP